MLQNQNVTSIHFITQASMDTFHPPPLAAFQRPLPALQLGALGIPVVMVSADEAGCRETRQWLGDIEPAPVKKRLSTHAAISLHPQDADDLIRSKAKRVLERISDFQPLRTNGPLELRVDCFTGQQAKVRAAKACGQPIGPTSFVVRAENPLDLAC